MAAQLGLDAGAKTHDALAAFGMPCRHTVHKGEALFPRIDAEKELEELRMEKEQRCSRPRRPGACTCRQ